MERNVCPFLGLPDDESTNLDFPSDGNFCHRADPAAPASHAHQSAYCLTAQHAACPVFLEARAAPLPAQIAAPRPLWSRVRERLSSSLVPAVVIVVYLFSVLFNGAGAEAAAKFMSLFNPSQPPIQQQMGIPAWGLVGTPPSLPDSPAAPKPTEEQPTTKSCPVPPGWEPYTVQPTDTLYRLSVVYGVSVEALMQANCLESATVLEPGSTLFVPAPRPTATLTLTPTPLALMMNVVPASSSSSNDDEDRPQPTTAPTSAPVNVDPTRPPEEKKDENKGKDERRDKDEKKDKRKGKGKDK